MAIFLPVLRYEGQYVNEKSDEIFVGGMMKVY